MKDLRLSDWAHAKTWTELVREVDIYWWFPVWVHSHVIHAWVQYCWFLGISMLIWFFLNTRAVICKQVREVGSLIVAWEVILDWALFDDAEGHWPLPVFGKMVLGACLVAWWMVQLLESTAQALSGLCLIDVLSRSIIVIILNMNQVGSVSCIEWLSRYFISSESRRRIVPIMLL